MNNSNEFQVPKHIIGVAAYVENKQGEVLLVKTHARSDTWEIPGGQVEVGEALDDAVRRECFEETGIEIRPIGITGLYYNQSQAILAVVFRAEYVSGEIKLQADEIQDARFIQLNPHNFDSYITRPNMQSRIRDAMEKKAFVPYETWQVSPLRKLVGRLEFDR